MLERELLMNPTVFKKLKCWNNIEKKQFENNEFINDMPLAAKDKKAEEKTGVPSLTNNYFFKYHTVYISKHNRFAPYPKHSHKFLELNYMLSGTCKQTVDDNELTLHEGDILLMNIGCNHSIESLGENDILINLLFRDKSISFDLLNKIHSKNSLTYDFLSNVSLGKKTKRNFILFPQNSDIQKTMDSIIEEYYQQESFSNSIIESYLEILISKILRHHPIPTVKLHNEQEQLIFKCLKEIDENYANITLGELSTKFGYNKEYLGNLIRKYTKSNFSDLKTKQRLINANNLLQSSTLPVNKIIERVGIKNKNFFYKKFYDFYGVSPTKKRDNNSSSYKNM